MRWRCLRWRAPIGRIYISWYTYAGNAARSAIHWSYSLSVPHWIVALSHARRQTSGVACSHNRRRTQKSGVTAMVVRTLWGFSGRSGVTFHHEGLASRSWSSLRFVVAVATRRAWSRTALGFESAVARIAWLANAPPRLASADRSTSTSTRALSVPATCPSAAASAESTQPGPGQGVRARGGVWRRRAQRAGVIGADGQHTCMLADKPMARDWPSVSQPVGGRAGAWPAGSGSASAVVSQRLQVARQFANAASRGRAGNWEGVPEKIGGQALPYLAVDMLTQSSVAPIFATKRGSLPSLLVTFCTWHSLSLADSEARAAIHTDFA